MISTSVCPRPQGDSSRKKERYTRIIANAQSIPSNVRVGIQNTHPSSGNDGYVHVWIPAIVAAKAVIVWSFDKRRLYTAIMIVKVRGTYMQSRPNWIWLAKDPLQRRQRSMGVWTFVAACFDHTDHRFGSSEWLHGVVSTKQCGWICLFPLTFG